MVDNAQAEDSSDDRLLKPEINIQSDQQHATDQCSHLTNRKLMVWFALLAAIACIGLLMPMPVSGRWAEAFGDLFHAPLFGLLAFVSIWLLCRWYPTTSGKRLVARASFVAIIWVAAGIGIEWIQQQIGRSASWHDVYSNTLGILAATGWFAALILKHQHPKRWIAMRSLQASCVVLFIFAWWAPAKTLWDSFAAQRQFPLLSSFEKSVESERWYCHECTSAISNQFATDGMHSLRVEFPKHPHPSVTLSGFPPDWSSARSLELDVKLDSHSSEPLEVWINVMDVHFANYDSDVFRMPLTIHPGLPRHVSIPIEKIAAGPVERDLDIKKIHFVGVQSFEVDVPVTVFIDRVRLMMN